MCRILHVNIIIIHIHNFNDISGIQRYIIISVTWRTGLEVLEKTVTASPPGGAFLLEPSVSQTQTQLEACGTEGPLKVQEAGVYQINRQVGGAGGDFKPDVTMQPVVGVVWAVTYGSEQPVRPTRPPGWKTNMDSLFTYTMQS